MTLTFDYDESRAVLGPLSPNVQPLDYDMCEVHCERMRVPQGWDFVRLEAEPHASAQPDDSQDILALADAVREVGLRDCDEEPPKAQARTSATRRRHLWAVPS